MMYLEIAQHYGNVEVRASKDEVCPRDNALIVASHYVGWLSPASRDEKLYNIRSFAKELADISDAIIVDRTLRNS